MEKDQYKKLIKSIAASYQDATEQFISDSTDLLKLASKTKSGVMQTQISVDDMNQYYADALLDCLKNSNKLINDIAEKFFKGNYKEALAALNEIINNESAATKAKLKSYGLENDKEVKTDFLTVNYVTKYLKPLVTGKDLINLISQKEKDGVRTRATVALAALKNINDLYFKSPAAMNGLKRSIVDLTKISKMKSESYCSGKTLLEQAKEILLSEDTQKRLDADSLIDILRKDVTIKRYLKHILSSPEDMLFYAKGSLNIHKGKYATYADSEVTVMDYWDIFKPLEGEIKSRHAPIHNEREMKISIKDVKSAIIDKIKEIEKSYVSPRDNYFRRSKHKL